MTKREVFLEGGGPWGFRMNGGTDTGHPLRISRVNPGSKAAQHGVREGDVISAINGTPTRLLSNLESHALLRSAGSTLTLGLNQDSTGSPKRRSRDTLKRTDSGSGSQENKSYNESLTQAQDKTVIDASACTSSSQPNKEGKKIKKRRQEYSKDVKNKASESRSVDENAVLEADDIQLSNENQTSSNKMSASKARRLRRARLKNKIEVNVDDFIKEPSCDDKLSSSSNGTTDRENETVSASDNQNDDLFCDEKSKKGEKHNTDDAVSSTVVEIIEVFSSNLSKESSRLPEKIESVFDNEYGSALNNSKRENNKKRKSKSRIVVEDRNEEINSIENKIDINENEEQKKKRKSKTKVEEKSEEVVSTVNTTVVNENEDLSKKRKTKSKFRVEVGKEETVSTENETGINENEALGKIRKTKTKFQVDGNEETVSIENETVVNENEALGKKRKSKTKFQVADENKEIVSTENETLSKKRKTKTKFQVADENKEIVSTENETLSKKRKTKTKFQVAERNEVASIENTIGVNETEDRSKKPKNKSKVYGRDENNSVISIDNKTDVNVNENETHNKKCKSKKKTEDADSRSRNKELVSIVNKTDVNENEIRRLDIEDELSQTKEDCRRDNTMVVDTSESNETKRKKDVFETNIISSLPDSINSTIDVSRDTLCTDQNVFDKCDLHYYTDSESPAIEVFINPPTPTMGVENTFFGPDWEIVEEFDTSSAVSSDDDVHQDYLVHFPPNDLRAQISSPTLLLDDGADEYGLTVQDIRNPLIPPEEEEKLRCFLETLDLTRPEEYDDSSSCKSSEEAVAAVIDADQAVSYATKEEIVVYKHCKSRSIPEPCYIPTPRRHYLDVIAEENSDLSDCDRRSEGDKPWEDPETIRKNNEFDSIPDDWVDSENEGEFMSDDGGIKSWSEGTTLDEIDGVEIVYLDSDNSDDVIVSEPVVTEKEPQLVVVQTREIGSVLSVETDKSNSTKPNNNEITVLTEPSMQTADISESLISDNSITKICNIISENNLEKRNNDTGTSDISPDVGNKLKSVDVICGQGGIEASKLSKFSKSMDDNINHSGNDNLKNNVDTTENDQTDYERYSYTDIGPRCSNLHTLDLINTIENVNPISFQSFSKEVKTPNTELSTHDLIASNNANRHRFFSDMHSVLKDNLVSGNEDKSITPQEKLDVTVTPVLSRQNSSSSGTATTQNTTRCNTSLSPQFVEKDDKVYEKPSDLTGCNKTPESLKELSAKRVISLPNGIRILEEMGIIRFNSDFLVNPVDNPQNSPRNESRNSSIVPESLVDTRPISRPLSLGSCSLLNDVLSPRSSSVVFSPPPYINSPPYSLPDDHWISVETSEENLRVCLSPSQSKSRTVPSSPKEAAGLLDLHKKFIQRRGYHEDKYKNANQNLPSPDLIQLEYYSEKRKPHDYTPELLTEAANLLALKEYRHSRFAEKKNRFVKDEPLENPFKEVIDELSKVNEEIEDYESTVRVKNSRGNGDSDLIRDTKVTNNNKKSFIVNRNELKPRNLLFDKKESKRKCRVFDDSVYTGKIPDPCKIYSDTKGGELEVEESSKKGEPGRVLEPSDGSRLLALIQSQIYPAAKAHCPIATTALCNPLSDRSGQETGKNYTGSGDYVSGWLTMSSNIITGSDIKRVFDADQYRISKQGDIAVMLSPDAKRPERPKSLPPSVTSGGEIFRQKMYEEYMDKVAERHERRQQKVIKISDRPNSMYVSRDEIGEITVSSEVPKLEDEFMVKVRERMNKLGISLEDDDSQDNGLEKSDLPRHLQEFVQLTSESPAQNGVWSPAQTPEAQRKQFDFNSVQQEREKEKEEEVKKKKETTEAPAIWTPRSAPSPPVEKKAFRPVKFESPPPVRKHIPPQTEGAPKPPTSLPITPLDWNKKDQSDKLIVSESIETHRRLTTSQSAESSLATSTENTLPRAPNPTITLLQKAREGQLPRGAHYLEDETINDVPDEKPLVERNEIIYTVRRKYNTETEDKKPKKIVELGPRKFEGIGPITKEGIPIVLRSEVKEPNQQQWYKRMYDSLHKADNDREFVTVRYKPNRRGYPYSTGGGYLSEPDRIDYDSDAAYSKYATLDRRRIRNKENDFTTSTMPRSKYASNSNSVKHAVDVYKNQPGRIEDYEPGHSSISEKEAKQWWDEVLDIFDEQFEQSQKASRPPPSTPNTGKPFMTYALKESGYESDSTLVFKRRDENLQNQLAMSPAEQKMAYKVIQKGGEVPLHGLRKPAPERPKEPVSGGAIPVPERDFHSKQPRPESPHRYVESEVTIHYRSPVRSEAKEAWSEEELARRQAEAMRRIYQEERRRKYLQELQDMYSRRHTDNFIPSQKSPIPLNRYDDFLDDLSPTKRDHTPEPKLVARALYNFVGQSSRELTFRRGDVIFVRRQIDKNWYEGEHNAMIGLFPINYVEIIPYDGIRTTPKRPSEGQARAKFNFQAQTHLELSLVKGELVVLTRRVDDNWFEGKIGNRKGIFPVSYVEVLVEPGDRTVSPVRPTTPASNKPVASPASHSLMLNGGKNSLSHHHYTPPPPVSHTSLSRPTKTTSDLAPVNQALHIDTQSEPVPYRALYNYKPQNDDELELNEGDTVYVMEKCDDGWYVGSSQRTGCFGTFPGNYVQRLSRGH